MKLIIDIPEEDYNDIITCNPEVETEYVLDLLMKCVDNGTPIPDNATNGDVIKILFADFMYVPWKEWLMIDLPWWNVPYQKGGKE